LFHASTASEKNTSALVDAVQTVIGAPLVELPLVGVLELPLVGVLELPLVGVLELPLVGVLEPQAASVADRANAVAIASAR
jgi:hypothetical protein